MRPSPRCQLTSSQWDLGGHQSDHLTDTRPQPWGFAGRGLVRVPLRWGAKERGCITFSSDSGDKNTAPSPGYHQPSRNTLSSAFLKFTGICLLKMNSCYSFLLERPKRNNTFGRSCFLLTVPGKQWSFKQQSALSWLMFLKGQSGGGRGCGRREWKWGHHSGGCHSRLREKGCWPSSWSSSRNSKKLSGLVYLKGEWVGLAGELEVADKGK